MEKEREVTGLTKKRQQLAGRVTCSNYCLRAQLWSLGRLGRHRPADSVSLYIAGLGDAILWT